MDENTQNGQTPLIPTEEPMDHLYSVDPCSQATKPPGTFNNEDSQSANITPAQREPQVNMDHMQASSNADDDGFTVYTSRKRKCQHENNGEVNQLQETGLTVIFIPANPAVCLTKLSSLKLSEALETICQECILMIRPNKRLNLIAVDTRNAYATKLLLKVTTLCQVDVRAYEPCPRSAAVGIIKGVDQEITDMQLQDELSAEPVPILHARRLGKSSVVKVQFATTQLPDYALLSRVRYRVFPFEERPLQCTNCGRYGHKTVACFRETICSRCGGKHDRNACESVEPKCINCGSCHEALAQGCPKRIEQKRLAEVRRQGHTTVSNNSQAHVQHETTHQNQQSQPRDLNDFPSLPSTSKEDVQVNQSLSQNAVKRTYSDSLKSVEPQSAPVLKNDTIHSISPLPPIKGTSSETPHREYLNAREKTAKPVSCTSEPNIANDGESIFSSALRIIIDIISRFLNTQQSEWAKMIQKGLDLISPLLFAWIK